MKGQALYKGLTQVKTQRVGIAKSGLFRYFGSIKPTHAETRKRHGERSGLFMFVAVEIGRMAFTPKMGKNSLKSLDRSYVSDPGIKDPQITLSIPDFGCCFFLE